MQEDDSNPEWDKIIRNAVILACFVGIIVSAYFISQGEEHFSALYIKSYSNYVNGSSVSLVYGVRCFEGENIKYDIEIFLNDLPMYETQFEIDGGSLEREVEIGVPGDTVFPSKVSIILTKGNDTYDTHFWLNGRV